MNSEQDAVALSRSRLLACPACTQVTAVLFAVLLGFLCSFATYAAQGQQLAQSDYTMLKGRWEGTIAGTFRSQVVQWRFEIDGDGKLQGFMGPASAGMPALPMQNLVVSAQSLSFSIDEQHAVFQGEISDSGISGSWQQGTSFPLQMKKKIYAFPHAAAVIQALKGNWEMAYTNTSVLLEFTDNGNATVSGLLDVPSLRLSGLPLVDIFVSEDGYTTFATDNGRRFTGRLVNGVMVGDYQSGRSRNLRSFVRRDLKTGTYNLNLSEQVKTQLNGTWRSRGSINGITLTIETTADYVTRGILTIPRNGTDPLLEIALQGNSISFLSFSGRTFTGTLAENEMTGQYRISNRPYRVAFVRIPDAP